MQDGNKLLLSFFGLARRVTLYSAHGQKMSDVHIALPSCRHEAAG